MKRMTRYAVLLSLSFLSLGVLGFLVHGSTLLAPASNTWAPTPGAMAEARSGAAAALLSDGRVLISGGDGAAGPVASAETFNPDGAFSPVASMSFPRSRHVSVALKDGRVLVAGGVTADSSATSSVEIFDPSSGAWQAAGAMLEARAGATATLLSDGRVLVAGGENSGAASQSLEVFDPVSDSFLPAGVMTTPRMGHAAARLAEDHVLLAGGSDGANALASSEVWDAASGSVTLGPAMSVARQKLSATTLIDGSVLLAGGNDGTNDLASAELFDPAAGTVTPAGAMSAARSGHLAVFLPHNNSVLFAGGSAAGSAVELYQSWTGNFVATGSMSAARAQAAASATGSDGMLVVAGGLDTSHSPLATSEVYGFATIKTDADDYPPGTQVFMTGAGWEPGDSVNLTLHETGIPDPDPDIILTVTADEYGNISESSFFTDPHDLGVRFYLTAVGTSSQAQTTFTDAGAPFKVFFATSGVPSGASISVNWSGLNNGGHAASGSQSLTTPGPSLNISVDPTSSFSFTFPATVTTGGNTYNFSSSDHTSPFTTGASGSSTTVTGTYVPADSTPPVITPNVTGTLGNNGWYTSDVSVSWTVTDPDSTVTSTTGCDPTTINADTAGTTLTCSATSAGGTNSQSVTIKRDATPPTYGSGAQIPEGNSYNWNNTNVTVNFPCADATSGSVTNLVAVTLTTEGAGQTATALSTDCEDNAGNHAAADATLSPINIDKTKPLVVFATLGSSPNGNDWFNADVEVFFNCTDNLDTPVPPDPVWIRSEGAGLTATSGTCTDVAGNVSDPLTVDGFNIDKTPPTASANASPGPNAHGWNNTDVTVTFNGSDGLSGIDTCDAPVVLSSEGAGQSASGKCKDKAGNESATATASGINIDKSNPVITYVNRSPLANGNGWNKTDVTVNWSCTDSVSGPVAASISHTVSTEGSGQSSTGTCEDLAGNSASDTQTGINIDKTVPTINASRTPDPNGFGWNNTDVTANYTASDGLSGLVESATGSFVFSGEGAGQSHTFTVHDQADNSASATIDNVNIDKTAPTISGSRAPLANAYGWNNSDVTVTFTCGDALSGVDTCGPTPQVVSAEGAGQSRTGTALDKAGNSAGPEVVGDINIDKTPPVVAVTGVSDGATYTLGAAPAAGCTTDGGLSGVQTNATVAVTGGVPPGVGTFTATCTGGKDKADNPQAAPVSVTYYVHYASPGMCSTGPGHVILQPIDLTGSSVFPKKGSTVPAKFRVCDANGNSIGTAGVVTAFQVIGAASGTVDPVPNEAVPSTTPDSAFRWSGDQWIYNISTKPFDSSKTYFFRITLNDGTMIEFNFGLR